MILRRVPRIGRFALVGGAATACYAGLAWAGTALGLPAALASLGAYALAALLSYTGHRLMTFAGEAAHGRAAPRFAALTLAGYGAALAIPAALTDGLGAPPLVPIALTCLAVPALNYVVLRRYVFAGAAGPASPPGLAETP